MAGFPAGTVSGAPKVRAMEIIDELEDEKRGLYAGCVGYFSANGEMDTCIVLRTSVVKDGTMYVQAGAGIVADSVPEREQAECVSKAARPVPRRRRSRALCRARQAGPVSMLILSLLRHAKSSWKDPTIADHDRPLNTRGTAEAPVMGKAMAEHGIDPDLVLCSSARRTRDTLATGAA